MLAKYCANVSIPLRVIVFREAGNKGGDFSRSGIHAD